MTGDIREHPQSYRQSMLYKKSLSFKIKQLGLRKHHYKTVRKAVLFVIAQNIKMFINDTLAF